MQLQPKYQPQNTSSGALLNLFNKCDSLVMAVTFRTAIIHQAIFALVKKMAHLAQNAECQIVGVYLFRFPTHVIVNINYWRLEEYRK